MSHPYDDLDYDDLPRPEVKPRTMTKSEFVEKKIDDQIDRGEKRILHWLGEKFGTVALRGLSWDDRFELSRILDGMARDVIQPVQGFYLGQAVDDAIRNSGNMLRVALAVSERGRLDAGGEPNPELASFIKGEPQSEETPAGPSTESTSGAESK